MLIDYENASMRALFTDFSLLQKKLGLEISRSVKKRIDHLKASPNFLVFLTTGLGKPHPLSGNLRWHYGISITGNVRLVVRPDSRSLDLGELKQCETVIIKGVMDYHGKKTWYIP